MAFGTAPEARFNITAHDRTKAAFASIRTNMNKVASSANLMRGAVVALAGVAAIGVLIKKSLDAADSIGKMADAIGISTNTLQEYRFAADLAGIEQAKLDKAMIKFAKGVGEARSGTGTLITLLNKLDKQFLENIKGAQTTDEALDLFLKKVDSLGNSLDKTALLAAGFGSKAGPQMAILLKDGIEGLAAMRQEAHDLGLVMDETLIRQAEIAKDDLTRLSTVIGTQVTIAFAQLAPHVSVIANKFREAAVENGGFAEVVLSTAESVVMAIAKIADVIHGLKLLWALDRLIFAQWASFVLNGLEDVAEAIVKVANLIPGVELKVPESLAESAKEARAEVDTLSLNLQDLIDEGLPSERVGQFFDEVRAQAALAAAAIASTRTDGGGGEDAPSGDDKAAKELEKLRESMAAKLEVIEIGLLSEEEAENLAFIRKLEILSANMDLEGEQRTRFNQIKEDLELRHQEKLRKIEEKGWTARQKFENKSMQDKAKTIFGELNNITQGVASHNKALFRINQVASIAEAIINANTGASRTLATYPWPLAGVLAGLHYAAGAARVAAIASTSYGGGSSGASGGTSSGATPVFQADPVFGLPTDQATSNRTDVTINIGDAQFLSAEGVRQLIEQINEQIDDGVNIGSVRVA